MTSPSLHVRAVSFIFLNSENLRLLTVESLSKERVSTLELSGGSPTPDDLQLINTSFMSSNNQQQSSRNPVDSDPQTTTV